MSRLHSTMLIVEIGYIPGLSMDTYVSQFAVEMLSSCPSYAVQTLLCLTKGLLDFLGTPIYSVDAAG